MKIRRLSPSDAARFQALRLVALLDTPAAFASSHEEEKDLPLAAVERRLQERPGQATFGAFDIPSSDVSVVAASRRPLEES